MSTQIKTGKNRWRILIATVGLVCFSTANLHAQEAPTTKSTMQESDAPENKDDQRQIERDQWTKYYAQQLPKYTFHLQSDQRNPLKVNPNKGLRYGNPVRGANDHGELFVWTHKGKCVLAGAILSYNMGVDRRRVAHEFHSFSTEKIIGSRSGGGSIETPAPGVKFKPIKNAPTPGKSRAQRMVQLRRLAKQFDAAATLRTGVDQPLRPLTQPVYRYETKTAEDDGAVFAYVMGTDPELLVAIETRLTTDGIKWHFAAARFTDLPISLKHKKETVWEFDQAETYVGGYTVEHGIDFQPNMPKLEDAESDDSAASGKGQ